MIKDIIDDLQNEWNVQRPDLITEPMGVVLRIQTLAKILGNQTAAKLQEFDLHWWQYDVLSTLRRQGKPFNYAPDDRSFITARLQELLNAGSDLLITTGGMSVDPDDVTRFAIRDLGADDITYGSAVLPGAMFLVAYLGGGSSACGVANGRDPDVQLPAPNTQHPIPILGIPACGMYAKTTVFDLVLPRILAGEKIGGNELAELGHGGLCMKCGTCSYPVCPFGK